MSQTCHEETHALKHLYSISSSMRERRRGDAERLQGLEGSRSVNDGDATNPKTKRPPEGGLCGVRS
jgi:hypothetical protein